jgi:pantoate--beta-alanine ligase
VALVRNAMAAEPLASTDYVEIVDADTFEPVERLRRSCLVLLAVFVGSTRLLDNLLIEEDENKEGSLRISL